MTDRDPRFRPPPADPPPGAGSAPRADPTPAAPDEGAATSQPASAGTTRQPEPTVHPQASGPSARGPLVEPPTPEIQWGGASGPSARLPGARREFTKFPTAPVDMPDLPGLHPDFEWTPEPDPTPQHGFLAPWALGFAIIALAGSLFVGWGFPLALGGIVTAIIALRRPLESRATAVWAIVLAAVSLLYSAGWLIWAANQASIVTIPIIR